MTKSPEPPPREVIDVTFLDLDLYNPRLGLSVSNQTEALREMTNAQSKEKFLTLLRHIHQHGLNPADSFIVIRRNSDRYTVLDGNRRLTAIKALGTPATLQNIFSDSAYSELEALHQTYITSPISKVACIVFETRRSADTWIRLAHDGESKGAGQVRWSAQQRHRYNASRSSARTNPTIIKALEFVYHLRAMDVTTSEGYKSGAFPLSILERLLSSPEVRLLLGIEKRDNEVFGWYPASELAKGLSAVVNSIGNKKLQTKHVHSKEQRLKYIHNLPDSDRPNPSTKLSEALPLADIIRGESGRGRGTYDLEGGNSVEEASEDASQDRTHESMRPARHSSTRTNLIPKSTAFKIPEGRINDIMVELKKLRLNKTPNAIAVLFRTFLELSVDNYIVSCQIAEGTGNSPLKKKIEAVSTFLAVNDIMTEKELLPVRRATSTDTDLNSVRTFHSFVHHRFHSPSGADLSAMWNSFEPFFKKIWEEVPPST